MKEKYITPTMRVIGGSREEVITTSNETPFVPFNTNETDGIQGFGGMKGAQICSNVINVCIMSSNDRSVGDDSCGSVRGKATERDV